MIILIILMVSVLIGLNDFMNHGPFQEENNKIE